MDVIKKYWKVGIVILCFIFNCFIWYAVWKELPTDYVTVAFLNIGQGDAIYIESPHHNRIIIDGGPPHAILSELRKVMPFYVRSVDTLFVTNPDTDHYAGFIDVLNSFHVKRIIEPGTISKTNTYKTFTGLYKEKNIPQVLARRGMIIHLGGETDITILFPDRDVSHLSTNEGSVIAKLTYKYNSVMLTGDSPNNIEEYVLSLDPAIMKSDVLKAGHHGSRTSASESFIRAVDPQYAIISAGVKNKYKHPHQETLDVFDTLNIPVLGTYDKGTIIMKLDGINILTEFKK